MKDVMKALDKMTKKIFSYNPKRNKKKRIKKREVEDVCNRGKTNT